jgi:hypothetical protein
VSIPVSMLGLLLQAIAERSNREAMSSWASLG